MDKKRALANVDKYLAAMKKTGAVPPDAAAIVPSEWAHKCPHGLDRDDTETLKEWGII